MSAAPRRVAVVMPPVTTMAPDDAVSSWGSVTAACDALVEAGRWQPEVHARHGTSDAVAVRDGVRYCFHSSDAALVQAVAASRPGVVHVHGLGWARLLRRLRAVPAPVVLQHHGEPVFTGRAKWGHRLVRSGVAGYMFTGASFGQAQPWIDAGVIARDARLFEVLEAASTLATDDGADALPVRLDGDPAVLWVGRLIEGKDPLTAIAAFADCGLHEAHLHLLATDRDMEPEVRAAIRVLGPVGERIHLHDPVPHARMAAWYAAADIVLSTSHREGSGYSVIEAVTCGCVPVLSAIPPHRAIVNDRGALFPPGDAAAAARALGDAAAAIREPTDRFARSLLSWGHVAAQLADAYDALQHGN